jgi:hypothetical protein
MVLALRNLDEAVGEVPGRGATELDDGGRGR